tara:strand:+ start:2969 stop:3364 length:396 start_codon:yes stop_codon:yes gene_type:complete
MRCNAIRKLGTREFWREDWKRTLEDTHWVFRNVLQVGRVTDYLDNKLTTNLTPGQRVASDIAITTALALDVFTLSSYAPKDPKKFESLLFLTGCANAGVGLLYHIKEINNRVDNYIKHTLLPNKMQQYPLQ